VIGEGPEIKFVHHRGGGVPRWNASRCIGVRQRGIEVLTVLVKSWGDFNTDHSCAVLSWEPVRTRVPSGENATAEM
jgi:hypothetical protein